MECKNLRRRIMIEKFGLNGKNAVITGGSGGIGSALALGMAECGADIMVADLSLDNFKETAVKIVALGRQAHICEVDVTSEDSVEKMVEQTLKIFPKIDILVNAAGISARKATDKVSVDEWQKVMDVNIRGTFIACQKAGIEMIRQGGGKIINISSVRGRYGIPNGASDYCSSKGAVDALTRALAVEWGRHNIRVNAIAPTVVETEFTREIFKRPEAVEMLKARIPIGRWAIPEDLVGPVVFLASEASEYINGQVIYIDGGMTAGT
jgi:gluconate 5-dehydrogenase